MALRLHCTIFRASTKFSSTVPCSDGNGKTKPVPPSAKSTTKWQKYAIEPRLTNQPRKNPISRELFQQAPIISRQGPSWPDRHRFQIVRDFTAQRKYLASSALYLATILPPSSQNLARTCPQIHLPKAVPAHPSSINKPFYARSLPF